MKHFIIVKFSDTVKEKEALYPEIEVLFKRQKKIEGIHQVSFYPSVIDLPNRYDFMILMELERGACCFRRFRYSPRLKAKYGSYHCQDDLCWIKRRMAKNSLKNSQPGIRRG